MMGTSDITGERIETLNQTIYSIKPTPPFVIVKFEVKGRIREILQPEIEVVAKTLRNGLTLEYESTDFKDRDDL